MMTNVHWAVRGLSFVVMAAGLYLLVGGAYLASLGGSLYYAITGSALIASGYMLFKGRLTSVWIYLAVLAGTFVWAFAEVGFSFWALVPRLVAPMVVGIVILFMVQLLKVEHGGPANARPFIAAGGALTLAFCGYFALMFSPHGVVQNPVKVTPGKVTEVTAAAGSDWYAYGRTGEGTRFAPFDQINRSNVSKLDIAWTARTGHIADDKQFMEDQNTPLYVDGLVYQCSAASAVTAIDGVTGQIAWRFDPKAKNPFWKRCRTLGYFDPGPGDSCGPRIVVATVDVRMFALKAKDGAICETFGEKGVVDLHIGMGEVTAGFLTQTTGAIVAGDKIMIGGWVADNVKTNEPSGVVRAFDAKTGAFAWAFDVGDLTNQGLPAPGKEFTRGTPNVWAPIAADVNLGLAYLPTGNATPDYYGGQRRPFDDEFNAAVVAVELATGKMRWRYRTVHHDIWDYDLPAQPALIDFPDGKGGVTPALLQLTKRGQIFVLDRRTREPLVKTEEKPAPQGDGTAVGEYYSKTQPYPTGMPAVGAELLNEARMWGATPFDQLLCRIMFRGANYQGDFTPQSTKPTINYPGNGGGFNWGAGAFDQSRNIFVVNDMRMPIYTHLIPRKDYPYTPETYKGGPHSGGSPQFGLPFAHSLKNFFSPIGIPCLEPPWGTVTGIDLATRQIIWQRPGGTSKDLTVFGVRPRLGFYVGMPTVGGPVATKGGVAFHSGTQDYYLRAYDTETGEELWKGRLPSGSQATPMSYMGKDGRQYVVLTAGGARDNPSDRADYVIAFALPK